MKKSEFIQEVCDEINTIKEKTTQRELNRLNIDDFDYKSSSNCIYGQMTGGCFSKRAIKLHPKKYDQISDYEIFDKKTCFSKLLKKPGNYFTALEQYLYICSKNKEKQIIQYLKGELDELYIN